MSTRFALACSALAALGLAVVVQAAAASDPTPERPVPVAAGQGSTSAVRPVAGRAPGPTPACNQQNVLASLRPQGPLLTPGQMPAGSTMARIAKRGYLIVGVLQDIPPLASRDLNRQLVGFDIDVARDIAEAIFGDRDPGRVVFQPLPEADRYATVRSGQVDLTVAAATITCLLRDQVDFSAVYYQAGQRVLVNGDSGFTGIDDLGGKRVCAASGSTSLMHIQAAASKPVPVSTATETDCLRLLQLGEIDAVSTDDTILAGMKAQDLRTQVVGPQFREEPYGVAINKNTPDLVRFVNAVLARRIEDGRWLASYQKWLKPLGPAPAPPTPQYQD
ncbi:MAG: glutamate ABC transporter substrate-binding protein [Pseudonocardiaceae bacterium]